MTILRLPRKTGAVSALLPVCLAASFAGAPAMAQQSPAQPSDEVQATDGQASPRSEPLELPETEVVASADASAGGLTESYRSEEHTSELQSREKLVCRLLLEKKK